MGYTLLAIPLLLVFTPPPQESLKPGEMKRYEAAKAAAGDDAKKLVPLALWCEARGLDEDRDALLAKAVKADPKDPTAQGLRAGSSMTGTGRPPNRWPRGQGGRGSDREARRVQRPPREDRPAGRLRSGGEAGWISAAWPNGPEVPGQDRPEAGARVYQARALVRAERPEGRGARQLHRRRPHRPLQRRDLAPPGLHQARRPLDEPRADRRRRERGGRAEARRPTLGPLLQKWAANSPTRRRRPRPGTFRQGHRPRAVPSIIRLFAENSPAGQTLAVRLLGQIDAPPATKELGALAVFGATPEVRHDAALALKGASPRLRRRARRHDPHALDLQGAAAARARDGGLLVVDSPRFHLVRTYKAPAPFRLGSTFHGYFGYGPDGLPSLVGSYEIRTDLRHGDTRRASCAQSDPAERRGRAVEMIAAANIKSRGRPPAAGRRHQRH